LIFKSAIGPYQLMLLVHKEGSLLEYRYSSNTLNERNLCLSTPIVVEINIQRLKTSIVILDWMEWYCY